MKVLITLLITFSSLPLSYANTTSPIWGGILRNSKTHKELALHCHQTSSENICNDFQVVESFSWNPTEVTRSRQLHYQHFNDRSLLSLAKFLKGILFYNQKRDKIVFPLFVHLTSKSKANQILDIDSNIFNIFYDIIEKMPVKVKPGHPDWSFSWPRIGESNLPYGSYLTLVDFPCDYLVRDYPYWNNVTQRGLRQTYIPEDESVDEVIKEWTEAGFITVIR